MIEWTSQKSTKSTYLFALIGPKNQYYDYDLKVTCSKNRYEADI